ncbi:Ger(x)C family spore germination protein [Paenibacillus nasutitermitis]|uniref:Germination protein, Ger(X)C family n=1 Tax=Paenibacillus nasutitermitis TaxID=1652958 RepID=A0A917DQ58_9BACL|nr:Ger(x)C family spore germination protein [Paenibacillus nasutitermitis]GGD58531.1 hypothetical protein GCM10010911_15420 [Paenibacillus nasutitermitis]
MNAARIWGLAVSCFLLISTQGCANSQDIQNMAYVTAIGIDYVNGRYVSYVQVLNFVNVARTENLPQGTKVPVWVGKGDGDTVSGSLSAINATSQLRLYWGHVKAVILTENLLRKGVLETYQALNRYREVRYNILMYGTKEKLDDVLIQKSILNLPPLDSIVFTAAQMNSQKTYIIPISSNRIIAELNEPGEPCMLPSITIDRNNWTEDKKTKTMFDINGAYFFKNHIMNNWMSAEDLKGARWMEYKLDQTPVRIPKQGPPVAVVMMAHPKLSVEPVGSGDSSQFNMKVNVKGFVIELIKTTSITALEDQTREVIRDEIETTYRKALKAKCDPFKLQQTLYREKPATFRKLKEKQPFFLHEDSIREIKINVHLRSTGKYKGKTE